MDGVPKLHAGSTPGSSGLFSLEATTSGSGAHQLGMDGCGGVVPGPEVFGTIWPEAPGG